jgi:flagellar hook-associated protein 1 FlgK
MQVTYTDTATNTQHKLTIVRVDDPTALPLPNTTASDPNNRVIGVDWSGGLSSVVSQLNNKLNGKPQFSILSGTTLRVLDDGAANAINVNSVSATSTVTSLASGVPQLPFFLDATTPYTGAITGAGSELTGFAGRITVNTALVADPSKLVVFNTSPLTPSGDSTRPSFLYAQLTSASLSYLPTAGIGTAAAPFTGTLPAYLREVLSQQGSAADAAKNLSDGQDLVVNALKQRFSDSASVNVDQEMSNLLILQNTYGANARVISAVKEMFTALMNI